MEVTNLIKVSIYRIAILVNYIIKRAITNT
nr:MAG TPA: hypothetical protein [Caudoviricetes sp.]